MNGGAHDWADDDRLTLLVPCPHCLAPPGVECVGTLGGFPHVIRYHAALIVREVGATDWDELNEDGP